MKFCQEFSNSTSVTRHGVLANECFLDGMFLQPHIIFMLVSVPILIAWNKSHYGSISPKSWVHFPGHDLRWILTILLCICNILETGEGIISNTMYQGTHLHLYIPHVIALLGAVCSIVYYHNVEMWNSPRFLLLLHVYWILAGTTKALKLVHLVDRELTPQHVRFNLTAIVIAIYVTLFMNEVYVFTQLKYMCFRKARVLRPPEELADTEYTYSYVNLLSKVTFFFTDKLLRMGAKQPLQMEQLGTAPPSEWSYVNYKKLKSAFEQEKKRARSKNQDPNLWRCYWAAFWRPLLLAGVFKFFGDLLTFVGPLCIARIIGYVEKRYAENVKQGTPELPRERQYVTMEDFFSNGYILALLMFMVSMVQNSLLQTHYHLVIREGIRLRAGLQAMVYDKALRLSVWTLSSGLLSQGSITNHLSVDAYNLKMIFYMIHYMWALPLQIIITMVLLYMTLGYSALIGGTVILLLSPLQYKLAQCFSGIQKKTLECSDERLRMCNELLQGIKSLKLYAWEHVFSDAVEKVRRRQLKLLFKGSCIAAITMFITNGAPVVVTLLAFSLYPYMQDEPLSAAKAFSSLALFDILSLPLHLFPLIVNVIINGKVSTGRLLPFFLAPEVKGYWPHNKGVPPVQLSRSDGVDTPDHPEDPEVQVDGEVKVIPGSGSGSMSGSEFKGSDMSPAPTPLEDSVFDSFSPRETRVHFFLDNESTETVLANGDTTHTNPSRLSRSADELVKGALPNLEEQYKEPPPQQKKRSRNANSESEANETTVPLLPKNEPRLSSAFPSPASTPGSGGSFGSFGKRRLRPKSAGSLHACHTDEHELYTLTEEKTPLPSRQNSVEGIGDQVKSREKTPAELLWGKKAFFAGLTPNRHSSAYPDALDALRGVGVALEIKGASFAWDLEFKAEDLHNINFRADAGKLTVIVGGVGTGKSSLLSAALGEMCTLGGSVRWRPKVTIAYVPQKPWLMNASLQDNILFGQTLEPRRYKRVLQACSLAPDIGILPAGDQTEIGEKGINLSGGQKQRICIARAMYSRADVVILDDPLSALDPHVGAHIFEDGILKFLLKRRRTVILVTHQLQYLENAHSIVHMGNGTVTYQGAPCEFQTSAPELWTTWQNAITLAKESVSTAPDDESNISRERKQLLRQVSTFEFRRQKSQMPETPWSHDDQMMVTSPRQNFFSRQMSQFSTMEDLSEQLNPFDVEFKAALSKRSHDTLDSALEPMTPGPLSPIDVLEDRECAVEEGEVGALMSVEERLVGSISWRMMWCYIKSCSVCLAVLVVLLQVGRTASSVCTDFWLSEWTSAANAIVTVNSTQQSGILDHYVQGFTGLALTTVILALLAAFVSQIAGLLGGAKLHRIMLENIVQAPMRFFDTTPTGRIINRFAGDSFTVDERLPNSVEGLIRTTLLCTSAMFVNAIATPYFLVAAVPIIIAYILLQKYYRMSARELQRLDNISKSPIYAHFSETLNGLQTIRAFRDEDKFRHVILDRIDKNNTAYLWLNAANRWLGIRLDYLGALIVFAAAVCTVTVGIMGHISSGLVGLAIAYALMISSYLNWVVRTLSDTEMQMNSVERMAHYANIPREKCVDKEEEQKTPESWPRKGHVVFRNVSLRYDLSLDPVIKSVSLTVEHGQKIGICGRTGSGKSSLTLGLFRLIDICEGQILIDAVDITRIKLNHLRSQLAIVPQDPVLFTGSIRFNLDPEGRCADNDLYRVLEMAQLTELVQQQAAGLDTDVTEGGENFSVGQRQLFCMARALLRDSNIVVMDEATASVDITTEAAIQKVMTEAFKEKTVFTIAHRISTILHSDKILVLDAGRLAEFDSPKALLANENSIFYSLVHGK